MLFRSARNLGWKLAAKLQGWGGETLLDSYSAERQPIFQETGRDFIAGRIREDREWLASHSPERDGNAAFAEAWGARKQVLDNRIQIYEPHYDGSPVIVGASGGHTGVHGKHAPDARAGHHLTPCALPCGQNSFELLGRDFTLLALGDDDHIGPAVRAFEAAARVLRVPLKIVRDRFEGEAVQLGKRLILVRPDHFVAWADDALSAPAEKILGRCVGV